MNNSTRSAFILFNIFILLSSALASYTRAYAMDRYIVTGDDAPIVENQVPTPYPTLTPVNITMQAPLQYQPTADFTCPVGVPAGYGTVTPSVDWLFACGQCLPTTTPQAFYTSTAGPTHTPVFNNQNPPAVCQTVPAGGEVCYTTTPDVPTTTPTAFPTATLSPPTATASGVYFNASVVTSNPSGIHTYSPEVIGIYDYLRTGGSFGPAVDMARLSFARSTTIPLNHPIYWRHSEFTVVQHNTDNGNRNHFLRRYSTIGILNDQIGTWVGLGGTSTLTYPADSGVFYPSGNTGYVYGLYIQALQDSPTPNWDLVSFYVEYIEFSLLPFEEEEPTPSPTPTALGTNFCDSVSDGMLPNPFDFGGDGQIVRQTCAVIPAIDLKQFLINLVAGVVSWFFPEVQTFLDELIPVNIIFNPLTVCVRERDYSLYLFGIRMPIEFMIGFAIVVSALRFWGASLTGASGMAGRVQPDTPASHVKGLRKFD